MALLMAELNLPGDGAAMVGKLTSLFFWRYVSALLIA
jgi:hypothetical protein